MAMLRPIDVIFKHPTKKFTVIYQSGKLWQLNHLAFDGKSLSHKRPYTGSREQIFVAQDQSLPANDLLLRSQLATIALPATIIGRNAEEFEQWWRQNSFDYRELSTLAKAAQRQAKAQLTQPDLAHSASDQYSPSSQINTHTPSDVQPKLVAPVSTPSKSESR